MVSNKSGGALVVGFILLALWACGGGGGEADARPDCDFTLEWGLRDGASFTPFRSGDDAEITLGFQGFRYIDSSVKLVDIAAEKASVSFQIEVEGQAPWTQNFGTEVETDGAYVDVLVFFNDLPVSELIGRRARVRVRSVANACVGAYDTSVILKDDDNCLETSDGGLECDADAG